jgi:hypothetical protein
MRSRGGWTSRDLPVPATIILTILAVCSALTAGPQAPPSKPWQDAATTAAERRAAENRPLFAASEPLAFTLRADFKAVQRDRNVESTATHPATLVVPAGDGTDRSIPVRIRTRGHSRRKPGLCTFAPLRIEFGSNPIGTLFEGQTHLKLGTHCRETDEFEQHVLREYAVYRMFNVLTPRSYRVRLAQALYVDEKSGKRVATRAALFLEHDDDVARRLEGRSSDLLRVPFFRTDLDTTMVMTLFEYMIGNTDMSILGQHNVRLVETPGGAFLPIPYDFDSSGVVNARYARPGPQLGLSSVRERLYRGPCRTPEQLEPYFARFRAARAEMLRVYEAVPRIHPDYPREARVYLEEFFGTIDRPDRVNRTFIDGCNSRAGM